MALHLPTELLNTCSGLEPAPRCERSNYQPDADDPMSLFTPILKALQRKLFLRLRQYRNVSTNHGLPTLVKMQSKNATGPLRDWQSSYRQCRKDEVVLCHARISHTQLTHSYILSKDPPPQCEHCQCIQTVRHILVELFILL